MKQIHKDAVIEFLLTPLFWFVVVIASAVHFVMIVFGSEYGLMDKPEEKRWQKRDDE
jgi:hypothetical protein